MNFAQLNQTWNKQSDLSMSDWDPFPELKGPDCWPKPRENFCMPNNDCGRYTKLDDTYCGNIEPESRGLGKIRMSHESYKAPRTEFAKQKTGPYPTVSKTWKIQEKYTI